MKYAIVEDGGKQFKVAEGDTIEVDHYQVEIGDEVNLDRVLLLVNDEKVSVGTPLVEEVRIKATVLEHTKGPKVTIFKYKPKKRYRVKTGHRQKYTRLHIDTITTGDSKKKEKKEK